MDILPALTLMLVLIAAGTVYAFYAFPPAFVSKKTLAVFNNMVMGIGALFCLVYVANVAVFFDTIALEQYRPLLMAVGVCAILIVYLAVFFVLRNFWIFKRSNSRPGL